MANYMPDIESALDHNRDENSFTSRLFHGVLKPLWEQDKEAFGQFLNFLKRASNVNGIKERFPRAKVSGWNFCEALLRSGKKERIRPQME